MICPAGKSESLTIRATFAPKAARGIRFDKCFWHNLLQCKSYQRCGSAAPGSRSVSAGCKASAAAGCSAKSLLRNVALHLHGLGQTLCHKLKNGSLNYASWRSLLPDNLLQAFNRFWGKQTFARFPAHSRRDMLNDEYLPLLLKDIGDCLFLKGFFPFIAHRRFSSP